MSDSNQSGAFGMLVLIAALVVIGAGGVLMWSMLQDKAETPRPETPERYLKPTDSAANPPAKFSDEKVDEDNLIP